MSLGMAVMRLVSAVCCMVIGILACPFGMSKRYRWLTNQWLAKIATTVMAARASLRSNVVKVVTWCGTDRNWRCFVAAGASGRS